VPENSELQGVGCGSRHSYVKVKCEAGKCEWQYRDVLITNSSACIYSCVKSGDIGRGQLCPNGHAAQVQKKRRPGFCTHPGSVGGKPHLFTGRVQAVSDTPFPGVRVVDQNGVEIA
jgi:hypothetical protein